MRTDVLGGSRCSMREWSLWRFVFFFRRLLPGELPMFSELPVAVVILTYSKLSDTIALQAKVIDLHLNFKDMPWAS